MNLIEKLFMAFTVVVCSIMFFVFCGNDATGSDRPHYDSTYSNTCHGVNIHECACFDENHTNECSSLVSKSDTVIP